jgi:hypothetical protein
MSLGIYIFSEGFSSVSEEAIWCFRGSYLSELARYMPEDNSKFDTLVRLLHIPAFSQNLCVCLG